MEKDFKHHTSYVGIFNNARNEIKREKQQKEINDRQIQTNEILLTKFDKITAENQDLKTRVKSFTD